MFEKLFVGVRGGEKLSKEKLAKEDHTTTLRGNV